MKEAINESITLSDLQNKIGEAIRGSLSREYWVRAEIADININATGHCYINLIEKEGDNGVKARAQAIIWASRYRLLSTLFEGTTGHTLTKGMNVLVKASVEYNILYGLSLQISDIDPSFTVGEQEIRRQQSIAKLKKEGMFDVNSSLQLPALPRRVAVISAESAAGYRDFITHLQNNEFGFQFKTVLFSAPLQGDSAPAGIIEALDAVASRVDEFDLLFIIRGGGGAQDLICFDDYELALNIAQFPLPVITGIGHDHDFHIADMVAHTYVKTPTAAADFLISIFSLEERQLNSFSQRLYLALQGRISEEGSRLTRFIELMERAINKRVSDQERRVELLQLRLKSANPLELLQKGYALTYKDGKRVFSGDSLKIDDHLTLKLSDSTFICQIKERLL